MSEGQQVLRRGAPVCQTLPGSFEQDPARAIGREPAEGLSRLAPERHKAESAPARRRPETFQERSPPHRIAVKQQEVDFEIQGNRLGYLRR